MNRKIYYWKLRGSEMQLGERTLIMGVLNLTPDSFSDGGLFNDPDRAYARALELEEQGADIIDIGAESTRPGSHRITADEEWQRLVPVLKRLKGNLRAPLSLDTYKSEIAERALQYGVEIFNDPSGLTFDPDMAKVAAQNDAGLILNHMRGQPETWARLSPMKDAIETIAKDLDATISRARHAGVDRGRIVIDPGLGFGKRKEQNAEILAHLRKLAELDYPILVGPSRKSFLTQSSENETLYATAAAVTACVLNGAHMVRVHDVREMQAVVQVAEEIAKAAAAVPRVEERPAAVRPPRPQRSQSGPEFTAERPRPPRPPLSRPALPNPALPKPEEEAPPKREFRPAAPPRDRRDDRRDDRPPRGFAPPRKFGSRPGGDDRPPRGFAPPRKSGARPGGDDRPPRGFAPPRKSGARPGGDDRPPRGFAPPRKSSGRPGGDDRPPRGFAPPRKSGGRPSGDDRPPRGFAPPRKSGGRPGGDDRSPKRPFRKRP